MTHMFEPRTAQSATFTNVSRRSLMRGAFATGTLIVGVASMVALTATLLQRKSG